MVNKRGVCWVERRPGGEEGGGLMVIIFHQVLQ